MNYLPFVSRYMYGGTDANERADGFISLGIMVGTLVAIIGMGGAIHSHHNIGYRFGQFLKKTTRWI